MRIAIIKNGIVVNCCRGDQAYLEKVGGVQSDTANIGDSYDGVTFTPYVKTPAELADEALVQADAEAMVQARADATIKYLVNHTPAEIDARVRQMVGAAGVTNLATAQVALVAIEDLLVRIGIALSVAAKDRLR